MSCHVCRFLHSLIRSVNRHVLHVMASLDSSSGSTSHDITSHRITPHHTAKTPSLCLGYLTHTYTHLSLSLSRVWVWSIHPLFLPAIHPSVSVS
mmetsp:Transcript_32384/g.93613  ORF Transcript_32384/g.93613 Transcript_32384/m.93613 type:complete len:94 (+) Transcript_32384:528-809(+)